MKSDIIPASTSRASLFSVGPLSWPGSADLLACFDCRRDVTLNSTLRRLSTSVAPTISSASSLSQRIPLWAQVETGGNLGVATLNISTDSGRRYVLLDELTAANIAIPGTDLTLHCVGPFVANDIFEASLASITDIGPSSYVLSSVDNTNSPPFEVKGLSNIFQRRCYGAMRQFSMEAETCLMVNSSGLASAAFSGTNKPWTVQCVGRLTGNLGLGSLAAFWAAGRTTSTTPFIDFGHNGSGAWRIDIRNDLLVQQTEIGGTSDHNLHVFTVIFTGTALKLRVDGVEIFDRASSPGAVTVDIFALLGRRRSNGITNTDDAKINGNLAYCAIYDSALSDDDASFNESLLQTFYRSGNSFSDVNIVIAGDSQSVGSGVTWPLQILWENDSDDTTTATTPTVTNLAFAGATMQDFEGAAQQALIAAAFVPGARNLLITMLGENDLQLDGTGNLDTLLAKAASYYAQVEAIGFTNRININAPIRGNPPATAYLDKSATYNDYLASVTEHQKLVNSRSVPGTPGDGIFWAALPDVTHFARQGYSILSDLIQPAYRYAVHGE